MVNLYNIWNCLIKRLNSIDNKYIFLKGNTTHKVPQLPYCIVNILSPYIQDKDDIRGTLQYKNTIEGLRLQRLEEPQLSFSLTFYADSYKNVLSFIKDTVDYLQMAGQHDLETDGIILLDVGNATDRTTLLETNYVYKYGFDMTVRVLDIVEINIDAIESVEVENTNNNEKINIEGGN